MSEHQNIEYKQKWDDDYFKWICGFANADGGTLFIGKNDSGAVVGIDNAKKLLEDLPNRIRDFMGILVSVRLRKQGGKAYLEIAVESYPIPVSYKGQYHYRTGATKQELKGAALDHFLLRKQGRHWDGVPVPYVTAKDLSKIALDKFRDHARKSIRLDATILKDSNAGLIEKLHLLDGAYLKRAAVMLFHADPEKFVTGAYVKIGFFRNNTDLLYHDEIHGDLISQAEATLELVKTKYLRAGISYRGIQRIESFPVPEEALREAILNAIIHKDYSSGSPIQISVYEDKIMVWNTGELPPSWTVAKLKEKHPSQPFNPDIANAFFRAGQIEAWGRGIERIVKSCTSQGLATPTIHVEQTGVWIEMYFAKKIRPTTQEIAQETTQETTQEKILAALRADHKISRKQLAEQLDLSEEGVKYHLRKLQSQHAIRRIGSTKAGQWDLIAESTPKLHVKEVRATTQETTQEKILSLLRNHPKISRKQLAEKMSLSEDRIKYRLRKLQLQKQIQRIGSTKAGQWKVLGT